MFPKQKNNKGRENYMRIGKIIQALREERDITQKELANKININYSVMNRIESGERPVRDSEIVKIAKVLEVSTDYILGQTSIRNTADKISDAMEDDPELLVFWNNLKEREDLQLLFKQTRDLSPKGIKQIIRIIKAIEDEEDREQ